MRAYRNLALLVCIISLSLMGCGDGDTRTPDPSVHSFKFHFTSVSAADAADKTALTQSIQEQLKQPFEITHYEREEGQPAVIVQIDFPEDVDPEEIRKQLANVSDVESVEIY